MKDAYWLGVDYGVVDEARQLGVKLNVVEAGGYTELNKQISQIEDCVSTAPTPWQSARFPPTASTAHRGDHEKKSRSSTW